MYKKRSLVKFKGVIKREEVIAPYLTIKAGGKVNWFSIPSNIEDLVSIIDFIREIGCKWFVLGNGSKILIPDEGFDGAVIYTGILRNFSLEEDRINLESGYPLGSAIKLAVTNNLSGIEALIGIPATIGGAVVMNAGTGYGCIGDVVESVEVINENGEYTIIRNPSFNYRGSELKGGNTIITRVSLKLKRTPLEEIREKLNWATSLRKEQPQFPRQFGSMFKNPPGVAAGRLIEETGFKGFSYNKVQISPIHANFLLNFGVSANDIYYVIKLIQEKVYKQFNIILEPEVNIIGF